MLTINNIYVIIRSIRRVTECYPSKNKQKREVTMATNQNDKNTNKRFFQELTSPITESVFSHINTPTENLRGDMQYEINLKLDPSNSEHKVFIDLLNDTVSSAKDHLAAVGSTSDFRSVNWRVDKDADKNETGKVLLKLTTKKKPTLLASNGDIMSSAEELPMGAKIKVQFLVASYDVSGNAGVSLYLNIVTQAEDIQMGGAAAA